MKKFNIDIPKYDWLVRVYIGMNPNFAPEALDMLQSIGCGYKNLRNARKSLTEGNMDTGLTYSNKDERMSVVVIGKTSSAREFLDSLVHEIMHLSIHIAETYDIDLSGEELCYIGGDVARSFYPHCKEYLCCECNH